MAQYYQVVSEGDNAIEELRQLYPNVLEDRSVQYVINPEDHQQFQPQQVICYNSISNVVYHLNKRIMF